MRLGFKMKLKSGKLEDYIQRHRQVYPELQAEFIKAGVSDYTIWHDAETNYLFASVELENKEIWDNISSTAACQKWWKSMAPLMETNPDNSPVSSDLTLAYDFQKH